MSEAEKKWEKWIDTKFAGPTFAAKLSVEAYKAALRREIEKEMVVRGVHGHYADGRTFAFKKVLELLDTVEP